MSTSRPIVDAHCDTLLRLVQGGGRLKDTGKGHLDLDRLLRSPVGLQFFAVFVPPEYGEERGLRVLLKMVAAFRREMDEHQDVLHRVLGREDLHREGVGGLLSIEGLDAIGSDLDLFDLLSDLGVRSCLLTWNGRNRLADGNGDQGSGGGLSSLGKDAVRRMEELHMLPDVSHLSDPCFWDLLKVAKGPVIASHSDVRAIRNHPRNLTDDMIRALADRGGVVGINFYAEFLGEGEVTTTDLFRHMDHLLKVGGEDAVGFGSDFDGINRAPVGVDDILAFGPILEKMREVYGDPVAEKVAGANFRRVLETVLA